MSGYTVTGTGFKCDGCGSVTLVMEDSTLSRGYVGSVTFAGAEDAHALNEFYACKARCIRPAIEAVTGTVRPKRERKPKSAAVEPAGKGK